MMIRHTCGCSAARPCDVGAKLFDRKLRDRLVQHLERTIQVNRPYPEEERAAPIGVALGDTQAGQALRALRGRL